VVIRFGTNRQMQMNIVPVQFVLQSLSFYAANCANCAECRNKMPRRKAGHPTDLWLDSTEGTSKMVHFRVLKYDIWWQQFFTVRRYA